jgi:hypothetical protein
MSFANTTLCFSPHFSNALMAFLMSYLYSVKDELSIQGTNWFWAASLDLTLFLDFGISFPNVSRNKLFLSTKFIILGATDQ